MKTWQAAPILFGLSVAACGDDGNSGPLFPPAGSVAAEVRAELLANNVQPLAAPAPVRPALVELGRALMFDKILSGNRDIACMTCHLPALGTGDARSLAIGQGATGLGVDRVHPEQAFIPRNAPPLFNLHALNTTFWDGRLEVRGGALVTPAGDQVTPEMESVFEFGHFSAQPLFPVMSPEEMRGQSGNELAVIDDSDFTGVWSSLMERLGGIDLYRQMFEAAYPGTRFDDMTFAHASNAMMGFMFSEMSFNGSPFDRFLDGDDGALDDLELRGAREFVAQRCVICHSGAALTDNNFHNVVLAQIGPGQGDGPGGNDDFGRMRVTGDPLDQYAFRTTPLRNVELTGPFGHAGQFMDLAEFIDHYSDIEAKLGQYDASQLEPALRGTVVDNFDAILATADPLAIPVQFDAEVLEALTAFLLSMTDPAARDMDHVIPASVPSGLSIDR